MFPEISVIPYSTNPGRYCRYPSRRGFHKLCGLCPICIWHTLWYLTQKIYTGNGYSFIGWFSLTSHWFRFWVGLKSLNHNSISILFLVISACVLLKSPYDILKKKQETSFFLVQSPLGGFQLVMRGTPSSIAGWLMENPIVRSLDIWS